jgi:hypothetical protein
MRAGLTGDITPERCNDKNRNLEKALAVMRFLPTPVATIGTHGGPNQRDSSGRPGLQMAAMMLPTPTQSMVTYQDFEQAKYHSSKRPEYSKILLPTPRANKPEGFSSPGFRPTLNQVVTCEDKPVSGSLCPEFVREMMGYPEGWLD